MAQDIKRKGVLTFLQKGAPNVSKAVKGLTKDLGGVSKATKDVNKGQKQQQQQTPALTSSLGKWAKAGGAVAAAYAAISAGRKAWDMAKHSAEVQNIETAFRNLSETQGMVADQMLADMRRASRGTIDEANLMIQANQAALLGVDVSRFDDILEIARGSMLATGQSMDYMVQSLVTGLGRQSKLWLDNAGILFDLNAAHAEYAATLGKEAKELTEAERKQSFMNAALEAGLENAKKLATEGTTPAEEFARLQASMKDLGTALGEYLVGPLSKAAGFVADIVSGLTDIVKQGLVPGSAGDYEWDPAVGGLVKKGSLAGGIPRAEDVELPSFLRRVDEGEGLPVFLRRTEKDIEDEAQAALDYLMEHPPQFPALPAPVINEELSAKFWEATLPGIDPAVKKHHETFLEWQTKFQGDMDYFMGEHGLTWEEFTKQQGEMLQATYGDSGEFQMIMEQWTFFLSTVIPEAAEEGGLRTIEALKDVEFAVMGVGEAFAGLIMGNKLALKEGMKIIAAEAAARLKAVAAEASVEALWQTAQGVGALFWNPGKAAAHFKAAGLAAATAAAAGVAAGSVARTAGVGEQFGLGGGAAAGGIGGGQAGGSAATAGARSRESVNVTRTAPTTINITHIFNGPVYYASESHVSAQALQQVLDTGEVITPEQEVA